MDALVAERLALGKERYGHGVRPNDNTLEWGTKIDSWFEMAQEEFLDVMIYICADYIRTHNIAFEGGDANDKIVEFIKDHTKISSYYHKKCVEILKSIIKQNNISN